MADEQHGEVVKWGPFALGRNYDEVGPELGRLHEARHVNTGQAALAFLLTEHLQWSPEGEWDVRLRFGPGLPSVTVRVDQAPTSARSTELTDAFVQVTAALTRAENNVALREHLARGTVRPWRRWALWGLEGFAALALGLGLWRHGPQELETAPVMHREENRKEAWPTNDVHVDPTPTPPGKPPRSVKNQKRAPCTEGLEREVSGVCWVPVEQRPCPRQTEPYEGQCLLPVAAPRPVPTSVDAEAPKSAKFILSPYWQELKCEEPLLLARGIDEQDHRSVSSHQSCKIGL